MSPKNKPLDLDMLWRHGTCCRWRLRSALKSLPFWPRCQSLQTFPQEVTSSFELFQRQWAEARRRLLQPSISILSKFLSDHLPGTERFHPLNAPAQMSSLLEGCRLALTSRRSWNSPETRAVARKAPAAIFSWHQSYECQPAPAVLPTVLSSEEPPACDWTERWQFQGWVRGTYTYAEPSASPAAETNLGTWLSYTLSRGSGWDLQTQLMLEERESSLSSGELAYWQSTLCRPARDRDICPSSPLTLTLTQSDQPWTIMLCITGWMLS